MNAKRAFLYWQGLCLDRRRDACVPSGLFFGAGETPAHPDSGLIGYCQNTWHFDIFRKGSIVRRRWYFCSDRPLLDPYLTLIRTLQKQVGKCFDTLCDDYRNVWHIDMISFRLVCGRFLWRAEEGWWNLFAKLVKEFVYIRKKSYLCGLIFVGLCIYFLDKASDAAD